MDNLIRPKDLANKLGIGLSTLYEWMKEPDFPRKIKLGPQAVAFRVSEIEDWMERRTEPEEVKKEV